MTMRHFCLTVACLLALSCAYAPARPPPNADRNTITRAELADYADRTAYQAIAALKPTWLLPRGQVSITFPGSAYPTVFLDGVDVGGLGYLRMILASDVERVRRLSGPDATTRFGTGYPGGIIHLFGRRGG